MIEFGVLGPLQASRDGRVLQIGSAYKIRLVLAALLSRADQPVRLDWLIEVVWGEDPPASARRNIQQYIHRLRAVVGSDHISSWSGGYLIRAGDGLDATRLRGLATQGRAALRDGDVALGSERLRAALELWRGPAYAEFTDCPAIAAEAAQLEDLQLTVYEQWTEAELALGRHDAPVQVLSELVRAHPYRESLRGLLMGALYAGGRQAEALQLYREIRRLLAEQLGIEPGPQLQRLHEQMLRGDAPLALPGVDSLAATVGGVSVPRELPADVSGFTGRQEALDALDWLLPGDTASAPSTVAISAVSGTAGVGKTALAVHWAHRVQHRFPDGQLYVNLRGFDPSGAVMSPAEAIRRFLNALGVPPQRIPAELDAQANLYRTLLADKRVLVVLDNARDPEQVRPLLPGTPGCLALATSRNRLTSLIAAEGAHQLSLDLLTVEEARDLLTRRLGRTRLAADPDAVDGLITRCARLPLALAIVAANAATHPNLPLALLADQLRDSHDRLDVLSTVDSPATDARAVFSWSYQALGNESARLFRLLGLHPGPDITTAAAASLGALPIEEARSLLDHLAGAHLITEHTPGRYCFHDLLRAYATDLTHTLDPDEQRRAAIGRVLDHYLHTAHGADRLLNPASSALTLDAPRPGTMPEPLGDRAEALDWLTAEHRVLLAAVDHAAASGFDTHVWQLARSLWTFLDRRGLWHDCATVGRAGVAAAGRLADPAVQTPARRLLARACLRLGRLDDAHTELRHALDLTIQTGDLNERAHTHQNLAHMWERQGNHGEALDHARQALHLFGQVGDRIGQAGALNGVGWYHAHLGEYQHAITHCQQALRLLQELGDRPAQAATWDSLGYAHHNLRHHDDAVACYQHALDLARELGDRSNEAGVLTHLGDTYHAADNPDAAGHAWGQALTILDGLDHPDAGEIRAKLAALETSPMVSGASTSRP